MKILFIHQNFPSPYRYIAGYYAAHPDVTVAAIGETANFKYSLPGVDLYGYDIPLPASDNVDLLACDFEAQSRRGLAAAAVLKHLKEQGFEPDVICVNPDWGEGMFIRVYYPHTPILAYAETYYQPYGPDVDFDPQQPGTLGLRCLVQARNATRTLCLLQADHLQSPTMFQLEQLPPALRARCSLLHEGIDTTWNSPNPEAVFTVPQMHLTANNAALPAYVPSRDPALPPLRLSRRDEVFTFATRSLEPYRGWPSLARALPIIQAARPKAHCVIVGRTGVSYGAAPERSGEAGVDYNWRDLLLDELRGQLDFSRLHFTGNLPDEDLRNLFAISRAHVCLSYPFVASRSPLEAASTGTPLVASATAPLLEILEPGEAWRTPQASTGDNKFTIGNGVLWVDFFSPKSVAAAVLRLLEDEPLRTKLGQANREHVLQHYDLQRIWLPRWDTVIRTVAAKKTAP